MCTLAVYVAVADDIPLLIAANRDEFLDRPSADPAIIAYDPTVFAGQDLSAGGTWFGVNQHGLVIGLLNRRQVAEPDATRRSRGLLCLETLQTSSLDEAVEQLQRIPPRTYNGFNLLVADGRQAFVATNPSGSVQLTELSAGVHV